MKSFLNTLFDVIFPSICISCKKNKGFLCQSCIIISPSSEKESADWIFPIFDYRHPPIKRAIWLLKYKGKKDIAYIFAEIMYERILEELADLYKLENFKNPILIPIPLSLKRLRERGFNQSLLICKKLIEIDKNTNLTLEKDILIKPKETEHQAKIENREKRLKNILGSFSVKNIEKIKGKNIILIDDVTTTGATLTEARKILKKAGAKKIIAFTIAH